MAVLITQGTQTAIATDTEGTLNYQVINVNKGTISSIGTLPNIPGGSVVVTSGTVASGSITVTQGTITEVSAFGDAALLPIIGNKNVGDSASQKIIEIGGKDGGGTAREGMGN